MLHTLIKRVFSAVVFMLLLSGCMPTSIAPHLKPIAAYTHENLAAKQMKVSAPILVRIFKKESELEVWKEKDDGSYHLFRTYPICKWSGELGPKLKQGDKQAPEGFYKVRAGHMNPRSQYYLSFNLGYPNAYDRSYGRTGKHLMVHGDCSSAGCYAMTDALMEEIYLLAREAFKGGQKYIPVHAFPFRMTEENLARHKKHKWIKFWQNLAEGYRDFEISRKSPKVHVCGRRYVFNAKFKNPRAKINARWACPSYEKQAPEVYFGDANVQVSDYKKQFSYTPESLFSKQDDAGIGL
ncbi:MAG: murein L,D-transpeptidase family protein [Pseudomonadota bacterium]